MSKVSKAARQTRSQRKRLQENAEGERNAHVGQQDDNEKTMVSSDTTHSPEAKTAQECKPNISREKKQKTWNDMSHLSIKRFRDDDPTLTAGAKRDRAAKPYVACAEQDPSGRSLCKLCGNKIPKHDLRLCLVMECHKGYRNLCTLHQDCFWKHSETPKLENVDEIYLLPSVTTQQADALKTRFQRFQKEKGEIKSENSSR